MRLRPRRVKKSKLLIGRDSVGLAVFGIDEDQVDVGGDVEFASAQLAHADHDQRLLLAVAGYRSAEARGERCG